MSSPLLAAATVHVPVLLVCFTCLMVVCDDHLVPSVCHLVGRLSIPPHAAAASFLALATAAPEIVMNVIASTTGKVETSLSAILGSAIVAFGLIPAVCCLAAAPPEGMRLRTPVLARDSLAFAFSLALLITFFSEGKLDELECAALCACFVLYMAVVFLPTAISMRGGEAKRHYQTLPSSDTAAGAGEGAGGCAGAGPGVGAEAWAEAGHVRADTALMGGASSGSKGARADGGSYSSAEAAPHVSISVGDAAEDDAGGKEGGMGDDGRPQAAVQLAPCWASRL